MGNWMIVPSDSDMFHHGRLGQKWGHRNGPPYPLQMTKKAYKAAQKGVVAAAKATITVAKAAKKHHEESKVKKQNKEDVKERKKTEKLKQNAISKNSYQKLYDMKDRLTYNELNDAKNRIRLEQEIWSLANPKSPGFRDKVNKLFGGVRDVTGWLKTGKDAWNTLAEYYNSSEFGKSSPMKKIGGGGDNKGNNNNNNQNQNKNKESGSNIYNTYNFSGASFYSKGNGEYTTKNGETYSHNFNTNTQGLGSSKTNDNKKKRKKKKS